MLYIPITEETVKKLSQPSTDAKAIITSLSITELAALFLLLKLPQLSEKPNLLRNAERHLANFITTSKNLPPLVLQGFLFDLFKIGQLDIAMDLCPEIPICFINNQQVQLKKYLKSDGEWNWNFKEEENAVFSPSKVLSRHAKQADKTSEEQDRILNIILSEQDEPINIQGYAGTGKTRIISWLAESLDKETTLFLTEDKVQIEALKQRVPNSNGLTFREIAEIVFKMDLIGPVRHVQRRYGRKKTISANKLADFLQCYEIGGLSRGAVANLAWRIVSNFCHSADPYINSTHIRSSYPEKTLWHQEILLSIAKNLWELICIPSEGIELPIRNYHLVKALSLTGIGVPHSYRLNGIDRRCTHIIVDEMHNLSPPIHQIIQHSSQPVFRFGDCYQALNGFYAPHNTPPTLRRKTLSHSVRAGKNTENIYNNILEKHPITPEVDFSGSKVKSTKIKHLPKHEIPDKPCTILARNTWSVFTIIKLLNDNAANFHILGTAEDDLKWLINDAISFFKTGKKPRHYNFNNSISWDDFVEKNMEDRPAVLEIDKLIRTGFDYKHLENLIRSSSPSPDKSYVVGRVRDCRNHEYSKVRLWDDVPRENRYGKNEQAKTISHVYTGISRAQNELYIPENMLEWFEDF